MTDIRSDQIRSIGHIACNSFLTRRSPQLWRCRFRKVRNPRTCPFRASSRTQYNFPKGENIMLFYKLVDNGSHWYISHCRFQWFV